MDTAKSVLSDGSTLKGRSLVGIADLSRSEVEEVIAHAGHLKRAHQESPIQPTLAGKTLALVFQKPSLRTRVTFEVAMNRLGGNAIYLAPDDIKLGERESVEDVAKSLSRWVDVVAARTFSHSTVTGLAENASIPVINALSDLEHPCQALADLLTIAEHKLGRTGELDFSGLKVAFVGDGNNVANSLLLLFASMGLSLTVASPADYMPDADILKQSVEISEKTGCTIQTDTDPVKAVEDADVIYTDVWTSMGQESERQERIAAFVDYQINSDLMGKAKPDAIVLHCLPAHRGEEITADVIDGPQSVVFDQAENRLHAQMALLSLVL